MAVSTNCDDYLVIRVPVLYGPCDFQESAVLYMYKQVVDRVDCLVDHIQKRVPTLTTDIAKTIRGIRGPGVYNSASMAIKDLRETPVDLIFLDIQMPELSGIEFAKILPKETIQKCFIPKRTWKKS